MTRAGPRRVLECARRDVHHDFLRILVVATTLVAIALGVPVSSAPSAHLRGTAHPVVAHVRDAGSGDLVAARLTEQRTRAPAWPTFDTAAEPAVVLGTILLARFLPTLSQPPVPLGDHDVAVPGGARRRRSP